MRLKSILLLLTALTMSFISTAQNYPNRPLFGTAPNQDNTGRALTYGLKPIGDTAGSTVDTITIIPSNYERIYVVTLVDSCVIAIKSKATSFTGSRLHIIVENTAGSNHFVNFLGYSGLATQWVTSSSGTKLSPASSKRAMITYVCDGTAWIEEHRFTQP